MQECRGNEGGRLQTVTGCLVFQPTLPESAVMSSGSLSTLQVSELFGDTCLGQQQAHFSKCYFLFLCFLHHCAACLVDLLPSLYLGWGVLLPQPREEDDPYLGKKLLLLLRVGQA